MKVSELGAGGELWAEETGCWLVPSGLLESSATWLQRAHFPGEEAEAREADAAHPGFHHVRPGSPRFLQVLLESACCPTLLCDFGEVT